MVSDAFKQSRPLHQYNAFISASYGLRILIGWMINLIILRLIDLLAFIPTNWQYYVRDPLHRGGLTVMLKIERLIIWFLFFHNIKINIFLQYYQIRCITIFHWWCALCIFLFDLEMTWFNLYYFWLIFKNTRLSGKIGRYFFIWYMSWF